MNDVIKVRALRCTCGRHLEADDDTALHYLLREHVELQHPYAEPPTDELVRRVVSAAAYDLHRVLVGAHDGIEEEGFGPEPY
jgi:hypothetical protein